MIKTRAFRLVRLKNVHGLHLRPAMELSRHAQQFPCVIRIRYGDRQADAKSILDLISLAAGNGSALVLEAHGWGSAELDGLQELVEQAFQEPEERNPPHDSRNA